MQAERADRLRTIELGDDPRANFAVIARSLVEPSLRVRELAGGREFGRVMARDLDGLIDELTHFIGSPAFRVDRRG